MKELRYKIKAIYDNIKEENDRECIMQSEHFLNEAYSFIERKIRNKEFTGGFLEYE